MPTSRLTSLLAALCLSGCSAVPEFIRDPNAVLGSSRSASEVGSVHLDVVRVAPWAEVRESFRATFKMTADDALTQATAVHSYRNSILQEAVAGGVGAAIDGPTYNKTQQTTVTTGPAAAASAAPAAPAAEAAAAAGNAAEPRSTTTATRSIATPTAPPSEAVASLANLQVANPSTAPNGAGASAVPPAVKFATADALLRYVNTLNLGINEVTNECDYDAYVVMLKVSLIPLKRRQPYDAFIDISVVPDTPGELPDTDSCAGAGDVIVRTFSADSIENIGLDATHQTLQSLALALSVKSGLSNSKANLQSLTNAIERFQAIRPNSLLTMGKIGPSTMRVRLGAMQTGGRRYELVPMTHDIALLLLVPPSDKARRYWAAGRVFYTSAHTGRYFDEGTTKQEEAARTEYLRTVARQLNSRSSIIVDCGNGGSTCSEVEGLARHISSGAAGYYRFTTEAAHYGVVGPDQLILWQYLTRVAVEPDRATASFAVPAVTRSNCPPPQAAILVDDGLTTTVSLAITGRAGAPDIGELSAGKVTLVAPLTAAAGKATYSFPSLIALGIKNASSVSLQLRSDKATVPKCSSYKVAKALPRRTADQP